MLLVHVHASIPYTFGMATPPLAPNQLISTHNGTKRRKHEQTAIAQVDQLLLSSRRRESRRGVRFRPSPCAMRSSAKSATLSICHHEKRYRHTRRFWSGVETPATACCHLQRQSGHTVHAPHLSLDIKTAIFLSRCGSLVSIIPKVKSLSNKGEIQNRGQHSNLPTSWRKRGHTSNRDRVLQTVR